MGEVQRNLLQALIFGFDYSDKWGDMYNINFFQVLEGWVNNIRLHSRSRFYTRVVVICATRVGRRLAQKAQSSLQLFLDFEGLNDV